MATCLEDGSYGCPAWPFAIVEVKGNRGFYKYLCQLDYPGLEVENAMSLTLEYGEFADTNEEIQKLTGASKYNIEVSVAGFKQHWLMFENGRGYYSYGPDGQLERATLLTAEELQQMLDDREDCNTPSMHYKIQPDHQGRLLWISGPPGAGKSTSGQYLAKHEGYVYYEADCFMNFINPYIPLDVENPSTEIKHQKPLKVSVKTKIFSKLPKNNILSK